MKYIILVLMIVLGGCSLGEYTIRDVNKHVMNVTESDKLTVECLAGFLAGAAVNTDNEKIRDAISDIDSMVDIKHPDYKRCRVYGDETNILAISGKKGADDVIKKLISAGVF